ncbi:MAG: transporter [Elusimicrobia bacterium]|nr:transporter [Elusimicrobiota bacterium]
MNKVPVLLALLLTSRVYAAHPLSTDDTGTQGRSRRQLELNGEYGRDDARHGGQGAALLSYGLNNSLDVGLALPLQYLHPHEPADGRPRAGLADAGLELKWRLAEGHGWGLGLKPGLTLATGDTDRGFGSGRPTYRLAALADADAGPAKFLANLAFSRNDNSLGERYGLWHASAAVVLAVGSRLRVAGNAALDSNRDPASAAPPASFVGGVLVGVSGDLDLDLGWRTGLNAAYTEDSLLAGLTARF